MERTNENAIRFQQILDSSSFREEFRIGEYVETAVGLRVGLENGAHRLGGTAWNSGLLDDDLGTSGDSGNSASSEFNVAVEKAPDDQK